MKKFSLLFALIVFTTVDVSAATVVLDPDTNPQALSIAGAVGETYTVTPVSGAWNEDNGNVTGCNGSGSGCTEGFEFSYSVDPSQFIGGDTINVVSDKFSTAAAAFAASQGTTFTALSSTLIELFLDCGGCSNGIGSITLDILLGAIITPPAMTITPTLTGNDFLKLSFDPSNEVLDKEALQPKFTDLDAQYLATIKELEAITQQSIQLSDLDAMNSANDTDGYSAVLKIGTDLIVGQVIGGDVVFALKTLMGEKTLYDLTTELGKKGVGKLAENALEEAAARGAANEIGSKIAAAAGAIVTLTEFGGKILIEMYKEVQVSNNQASIDVVHSKMFDRIMKAKKEASVVFSSQNVDGLSTMSALARDLLRQKSKEPAINILKDIATTQKNIAKSASAGDKRILEGKLAGLKERAPFLLNAAIGESVPGERGTEKG